MEELLLLTAKQAAQLLGVSPDIFKISPGQARCPSPCGWAAPRAGLQHAWRRGRRRWRVRLPGKNRRRDVRQLKSAGKLIAWASASSNFVRSVQHERP